MASTDFAVRIGDDAADEFRRAHFAAARDAVSAAGGRRVKSVGDGIMAVFSSIGAALDCAVWIQQSVEELRRRYTGDVPGVRIGVSHGEATIEEGDWYGIPVVEASRLCERALGGQIVVAEVVRAIAAHRGRHEFEPLGVLELKGLREPLEAHQVLWSPTAARPAFPAGLGGAHGGLFVGRDAELGEMRGLWRTPDVRQARLLLLGGDPGIGKTRIAAELAREAYLSGAIVLFGRCDEEATTPYQPFAEALRTYVNADASDLSALPGLRELPRLVPEIAERSPGVAEPTKADAESERYLLFEAVTELLAHASTLAPVLLVLDDLHWATAATWLLLRHVVRSTKPVRLMLLGTYRDAELTREAADIVAALRGEAVVERLSLRGLDEASVPAFLQSIADDELDDRAAEVARAIHHETEGNPFFVTEVLAHLVESGVVYREGGRWTASPDVNVQRLDLPAGVSEVMSRRLTRLSEASNRALVVGAVAGPLFTLKTLESIPEAGPPEHVLDAIEEAVSAGLVRDVGRGRFVFAHALVRQVLYSGLTSSRRMQLHLRAAEAMEAGDDARPEVLAFHFAEAAPYGPIAKAVDYALAAGRRALERLAYEEAIAMFARGLAVLELQQPLDTRRRAELELEIGEASWCTADLVARNRYALAAAESAKACGRADMLGRAAALYFSTVFPGQTDEQGVALCEEALAVLPDSELSLRARVLSALAHYRNFGEARGAATGAIAEEALSTARRSGDPEAIAHALLVRTYALWGSPEISRAEALLTESVQRAEQSGNVFREVGALSARVRVRLELGNIAGFEEDLEREGELLARGVRDYWDAGRTTMRVLRSFLAGRFADADEELMKWTLQPGDALSLDVYAGMLFVLRREQGRAQEMVPLVYAATARWPDRLALRAYLAIALAETGDRDGARRELDIVADEGFAKLTRDITFTSALCAASQACGMVGATEYARQMYDLLREHSGHLALVPTADICVGSIDRHLGILATMLREFDTADAHFRAAIDLETRIPSPPFVARTQVWHAKMHLARGDARAAEPLLESALQTAVELGMAAIVSEAKTLLAGVSV